MYRYIISRFIQAIFVVLFVSTATFFLINVAPGGLSILMDPELDLETAQRIESNLGLDQPLHVQYVRWLGGLLKGDLGWSFINRRPVLDMVLERLPATILLSATSLFLAIVLGIPLGILAAKKHYSIYDHLATIGSFIGLATPNFWLAILLIFLFSVRLRILPSAGMYTIGEDFSVVDRLRHLVLPSIVLATGAMAQLTRYTRSSMLEVLVQEYIRTARAKGLSEAAITMRHELRNAMIPIMTIIGLLLPRLVGGAAITEAIFGWPGMGRLAVDAAFHRDYPLILGVTLLVSVMVVFTNLLVDVLYAYLDPRIRIGA
jgi:peptide/nickel transport system permease protein